MMARNVRDFGSTEGSKGSVRREDITSHTQGRAEIGFDGIGV